ncbi:MAG: hypothetical protein AAB940_01495 [Patescibacteria group bacterium]
MLCQSYPHPYLRVRNFTDKISENCFEEHPAGAISLVSAKRNYRAEGEENFAAGAKLFCF